MMHFEMIDRMVAGNANAPVILVAETCKSTSAIVATRPTRGTASKAWAGTSTIDEA